MPISICERLSFDKLFRISDPKRVYRSFTVRGPPLEIDSYQNAVYYAFNFKANPSTTGLRHRGYIKFFKPKHKSPKDVPLQHLECLVDCMCPDFRYRWAWANKQRGSSTVGPQSLNQAWNKAPRKTNPTGRPGLCKHVLAARRYIYGLLSSFPGTEPDTADKLNKLTKIATKRWTDFEGAQRAAKAREKVLLQRRAQRNVGMIKPQPMVPLTPSKKKPEEPVSDLEPLAKVKPAVLPPRYSRPEPLPPPEQKKSPSKQPADELSTNPEAKPKRVLGNRVVKGMLPGQVPGTWESLQNGILESVVNATGELKDMSTLKNAIKLVEEMEADELAFHKEPDGDEFGGAGGGAGVGAPDDGGGLGDMGTIDEPMEPPMSDSAIGADTEGETALGLLRQMKDFLGQIASAVAPEMGVEGEMDADGGLGGEEGGVPGGLPGGEGSEDMPPEPPGEMPDPEGEADAGEFEAGEEGEEPAEEEGQTRPAPKKKRRESEEED